MRVLAHIIFEAKSALRVGCGDADALQDSPVQRDFNGLPMVLGSSLAGALRARFEAGVRARRWDEICADLGGEVIDEIFGENGGENGENNPKISPQNAEKLHKKLQELDEYVQGEVARVFGTANGESGRDSQVIFSNALMVLGADGAVCEELRDLDELGAFARSLANLPLRQHNRIGANGAVAEGGKFDEEVVFAGTRFKFSIEAELADTGAGAGAGACENGANSGANSNLSGGAGAKNAPNGITRADFELLLGALQAGDFRLGASGARGFGRIGVVEIRYEIFGAGAGGEVPDASLNAKLSRVFELGGAGTINLNLGGANSSNSNLGANAGANPAQNSAKNGGTNATNSNLSAACGNPVGDFVRYALRLTPENVFLFGSGYGDLADGKDGLRADSVGVREAVADYAAGKLSQRRLLVPASSVKGALAHRTMYYINAEIGNFIGEKNAEQDERARRTHEALFGGVRDVAQNAGASAKNGAKNADKNAGANLSNSNLSASAGANGGAKTAANADDKTASEPVKTASEPAPATRKIGDKSAPAAQKGRVLFGDFYFDERTSGRAGQVFAHNRIDRLTGGVADGALFSERADGAGEFELEIWVQSEAAARRSFVAQAWALAQREYPENKSKPDPKLAQNRANSVSSYVREHEQDYARAVRCFERAMRDVCGGWLALGAAGAKGHGVFAGELSRGGEKLEVK